MCNIYLPLTPPGRCDPLPTPAALHECVCRAGALARSLLSKRPDTWHAAPCVREEQGMHARTDALQTHRADERTAAPPLEQQAHAAIARSHDLIARSHRLHAQLQRLLAGVPQQTPREARAWVR